MLGIPLRYLLTHPLSAADLVADPIETWTRIRDEYVAAREFRGTQCVYESDSAWEPWIHERLGVPWPCPFTTEFHTLWTEVIAELEAKGIKPGPESFVAWNDGDAGFVRAIWCLTRHLRPKTVVETGVAHGVTSRFILEALQRNGVGQLWSIDLPPIEKAWREQVGLAVTERNRKNWTYIKGSSRVRLPNLLSELGEIDMFVHDSIHSERNVRFEMDRVWGKLRTGGAMVVDDVDANWGFRSFGTEFSGHKSIVCDAEPIRPDLRRFNKKGLFGIVVKEPIPRVLAA
jgi:Methyltransferase domain